MTAVADGTEAPARRVPGQPDMWAFALFELLVVTAYIAVYFFNRTEHGDLYLQSQEKLDLYPATFNTVVLLTSSWSMARCVYAARAREFEVSLRAAWLTAGLAGLFFVSKVGGWIALRDDGFGVTTNEFFTYYYFLTGIHMLHLLIGFVALGILIYQLRGPTRRSNEVVETCGVYWHTVDLLWLLIFAVLYVVR